MRLEPPLFCGYSEFLQEIPVFARAVGYTRSLTTINGEIIGDGITRYTKETFWGYDLSKDSSGKVDIISISGPDNYYWITFDTASQSMIFAKVEVTESGSINAGPKLILSNFDNGKFRDYKNLF